MQPDTEWVTALLEQTVAEMSDAEFRGLVERTRPPTERRPSESEMPLTGDVVTVSALVAALADVDPATPPSSRSPAATNSCGSPRSL